MRPTAVNADKLAGADLRAFAQADDGTRPVIVELDAPGPRAAPPFAHMPPTRRPTLPPAEPAGDGDSERRMDALERELKALHPPVGPTRVDLARAFFLTVTPVILRAVTQLPHVGIVRPRQGVTAAG